MHQKLLYIIAITLLFAFSARTVANIKVNFIDKKVLLEQTESDEDNEKDISKEKPEPITYHSAPTRWRALVTAKVTFLNFNEHPATAKHFFAVPTPPPWLS
ncbi:hypothetical protein GCM10023149_09290 [Mucilaginibacter gynuensis]|uniref:Secreted protein n=1 Tax=Mucilaginibacter gynuensis TaxID=1302236 RepID=A0ABP8FYA1_9SPHI